MDQIARTLGIYLFLMVVFRITGKRTLKDVTIFDFVLLLALSESVQQALTRDDNSLTNAWILISTFVAVDIAMSLVKRRFPAFDKVMDGTSLIIVEDGKPMERRMRKERIDLEDVLEAARGKGFERLEQIKYAILEKNGNISIIPAGKGLPA